MTQRFLNKPKMKTTQNAQFRIQIILLSTQKRKACMQNKIVLATKKKKIGDNLPRNFLVMMCAKNFFFDVVCVW